MAATYGRLNESSYNKMYLLRFTDFNTVLLKDNEELTQKDFFKVLEKHLQSNKYNVDYNEEQNKFFITYDDVDYEVDLESDVMTNFLIGRLTPITRELAKLANLEIEHINGVERLEKIIENASNGIIYTDEERKIYLDYLVKEKSFKPKKIIKYVRNWFKDLGKAFTKTSQMFGNKGERFLIWCYSTLLNVFLGFLLSFLCNGLFHWPVLKVVSIIAYIPTGCYLLFSTLYFGFSRIDRGVNCFQNRKLLNTKINALSKQVIKEEKIIKVKEENCEKFNDITLEMIYNLLDKVSFIKEDNPKYKEYLEVIKKIFIDYDMKEKQFGPFKFWNIDDKQELMASIGKLEADINIEMQKYCVLDSKQNEKEVIEEKIATLENRAYVKSIGMRKYN